MPEVGEDRGAYVDPASGGGAVEGWGAVGESVERVEFVGELVEDDVVAVFGVAGGSLGLVPGDEDRAGAVAGEPVDGERSAGAGSRDGAGVFADADDRGRVDDDGGHVAVVVA